MQAFKMLRNAVVKVIGSETNPKKGDPKPLAKIVVNGEYETQFPETSRVSKALAYTDPEELSKRLSGGHYFYDNHGKLVDWRDGNYNGFVHGDEAISMLAETIGSTDSASVGRKEMKHLQFRNHLASPELGLFKMWGSNKVAVPGFGDGGLFSTSVHFNWNPFHQFVDTILYVKRLICANGMTGVTSWLNTKIPLINLWRENLDIAEAQIQRKVEDKLLSRLTQMSLTHATLADAQLLCDHAYARLMSKDHRSEMTPEERGRLEVIMTKTNPVLHTHEFYRPSVFTDKRRAAQLPSHLSQNTAFNIATELASHTREADESSDFGLMKFANQMLFTPIDYGSRAARFAKTLKSPFNDPEQAFHGITA